MMGGGGLGEKRGAGGGASSIHALAHLELKSLAFCDISRAFL